jgi:hypothetical protein
VNTPTPIMSATTIAVATRTETIEPPPGSRSGNAALPVPDIVMSGPRLGRLRPDARMVQAAPYQFKQG